MTYFDLVPSVPIEPSGDEKSPSSRSLAIRQAPCQLTPISSRSSLKVLRHVFFGLPLFLLPSSGTQYIAVWAGENSAVGGCGFLLLVPMSCCVNAMS